MARDARSQAKKAAKGKDKQEISSSSTAANADGNSGTCATFLSKLDAVLSKLVVDCWENGQKDHRVSPFGAAQDSTVGWTKTGRSRWLERRVHPSELMLLLAEQAASTDWWEGTHVLLNGWAGSLPVESTPFTRRTGDEEPKHSGLAHLCSDT